MPDEQGLIQQAAAGDKRAFAALVRQTQNRVFAFIMRMTANRESALDLTQDVFVAAWEHLAEFRSEAALSTWLIQIASNKTINFLKKAGRETALPENYDMASSAPGPDRDLEDKESRRRLLEEMGKLPPRQRSVFNLRFFEQMKFGEIARSLGISASAAKTSYAEAIKKLKQRLVTV